jgi:uracil-DNA glycosylase family 4
VGERAADGPLAVMLESPRAQEAATSRPLVGPDGQIFNNLLYDAGMRRDELVILNRVRCRPPQNKLANAPESLPYCNDWLIEELNEYNPSLVILMGATALKTIFGANAKVGQTRGSYRETPADDQYGQRLWTATYHPSSLADYRSPENWPLVVDDLKQAAQKWAELRA